jgi:hypothetical protein
MAQAQEQECLWDCTPPQSPRRQPRSKGRECLDTETPFMNKDCFPITPLVLVDKANKQLANCRSRQLRFRVPSSDTKPSSGGAALRP